MNRYLRDRLMKKYDEDGRRRRQDYEYDSRRQDYEYDSRRGRRMRSDREMDDGHYEYGRPVEFYTHGVGGMRYHDYRSDYSEDDIEYRYHKDLKHWIEKLKSKDKFNLSEEQVVQQAKSLGVHFKDYSELEFYAMYLAMVSDYHRILGNDVLLYIKMAREFLEDDDIAVTPSEKVCIYYYHIVKGE